MPVFDPLVFDPNVFDTGLVVLYEVLITPSPANVAVGSDVQLTATAYYSDGSSEDVTTLCDWFSDDTAVATIDSGTGLAHGLLEGSCEITADYNHGAYVANANLYVNEVIGNFLWWGPMMPDARHETYAMMGPGFPDYQQPTLIPPVGPGGIATFGLELEQGAKITLTWVTDIGKSYSGLEQRIEVIDEPKVSFDGNVLLVGDSARMTRAQLARGAAQGLPFLLGLSYEEMTITGAGAAVDQVPVRSTVDSDWALVYGQRVLIINTDEQSISAVIQSGGGSNFIQVDRDVSQYVRYNSRIMPEISILLEPTQGFARYPGSDATEMWGLKARALDYGFRSEATKASASLRDAGGQSHFLGTASVFFTGPAGNAYTLEFRPDATTTAFVTNTGVAYVLHFKPGTTPIGAVAALAGVFSFSATYINVHWRFELTDVATYTFSGGLDKSLGLWGTGGTVDTLWDRPIWDRYLQLEGTAADSIQALTEILDFDGVQVSVGQAPVADWGRAIMIRRRLGDEFEWLKAFLYNVAGRRKAFWVPTWRNDLEFVDDGDGSTTTCVISSDVDAGDFFAWYPDQRQFLQFWNSDGTFTRAKIYSAIDNHDGTISITCRDQTPAPTNAYVEFPNGHLGAGGYRMTRLSFAGATGNFGSITVLADGTGGDPVGGGGIQVTDDGVGNYVVHFNPGHAYVSELPFNIVLAYPGVFQFSNTTPSPAMLDITDVQPTLFFTNGVTVGTLGNLVVLPTGVVKMISWIELCRFANDEFEIEFSGANFSLETEARVVQR